MQHALEVAAVEDQQPVEAFAADGSDETLGDETLRKRVRQAEADSGLRPDLPTGQEREEVRELRKEVFELRRANEILESVSTTSACTKSSATVRRRKCRLSTLP